MTVAQVAQSREAAWRAETYQRPLFRTADRSSSAFPAGAAKEQSV